MRPWYRSLVAIRRVGWEAIAFAERSGTTLSLRAEGADPARDGVSVEEARKIAARTPERIYVDYDETPRGGSAVA